MSSVFFDRERIADWLGDHTVAGQRYLAEQFAGGDVVAGDRAGAVVGPEDEEFGVWSGLVQDGE